jgi:arylsulfatase A-like enzyme
VIDTLRADHLGAYGYAQPVSPHLDALAARATLFENAIAQAPHTIPSMLQMMTSRYAEGEQIPGGHRTLAEALRAAGYETIAVVENPNLELDPGAHGLMRGFERFDRNGVLDRNDAAQQLYKTGTTADAVTAQAVRRLRRRDRSRPLFLWVHYSDPHDPYLPPYDDQLESLGRGDGAYTGDVRNGELYRALAPPVPSADELARIVALYDAEVRHADRAAGDLFAALRAERAFDRALVIVASDHGESLGEHRVWTHGRSCYEPEIHVPLIVKRPRQSRSERRREAVELLDVFPTVLEQARVPAEGLKLDGAGLFEPRTRPAFVFWNGWQVVRTADWKLTEKGGGVWLHRLPEDRAETADQFARRPDVARSLVDARAARLRELGAGAGELQQPSQAALERLRALGYVDR